MPRGLRSHRWWILSNKRLQTAEAFIEAEKRGSRNLAGKPERSVASSFYYASNEQKNMFARELEECCDTHKKLTENVSYVFGIGGVYSVQYSVNTSISPS